VIVDDYGTIPLNIVRHSLLIARF